MIFELFSSFFNQLAILWYRVVRPVGAGTFSMMICTISLAAEQNLITNDQVNVQFLVIIRPKLEHTTVQWANIFAKKELIQGIYSS